jgi:hypothetical protein
MQRFFFLLACFAGIGHSRNHEQQETSQDAAQTLRSLRALLFARGPAARFGNRVRAVSGQSARHIKSPVANTESGTTAPEATFDVKQLAGITAPLGFFDPLGFTTDKSEGKIRFYREVELKHGRLGMLAALGFLVGENFHPLFGGNIDSPAYLAFQQTPLQTFWPVVVLGIAILETFSVFTFNSPAGGEPWSIRSDHVPGNLGLNWDRVDLTDPEYFKTMQTKELNNGRLAMLAAAGMILQEYATGQKLF